MFLLNNKKVYFLLLKKFTFKHSTVITKAPHLTELKIPPTRVRVYFRLGSIPGEGGGELSCLSVFLLHLLLHGLCTPHRGGLPREGFT